VCVSCEPKRLSKPNNSKSTYAGLGAVVSDQGHVGSKGRNNALAPEAVVNLLLGVGGSEGNAVVEQAQQTGGIAK
jgi:hypothetical protein